MSAADGPVGEHTAATATGDAHLRRIDVAAFQNLVDADHQILVVVAGIVVLDDVGEILTVGSAAARIYVDDNVTLGCHPIELVGEGVPVCSVRSAVDLQNHRILSRCAEGRRLQNPPLNVFAVEAVVGDFFGGRDVEGAEQGIVDASDPARAARGGRGGGGRVGEVESA